MIVRVELNSDAPVGLQAGIHSPGVTETGVMTTDDPAFARRSEPVVHLFPVVVVCILEAPVSSTLGLPSIVVNVVIAQREVVTGRAEKAAGRPYFLKVIELITMSKLREIAR
jgi:hypothetical protein